MNLPNRLTLLRILMVPVFLAILSLRLPLGDYIAAGVFVLAACTDGLDGYIARKKKMITALGKLLDPLADKLLVSSALIALVEMDRLSGWVAVIIIGREFAVTGLRSLAAAEGVIISASRLGKIKTITQIVAIVAMFLRDFPFNLINVPFGNIAMSVAVIFTIWSGMDYFQQAGFLLKSKNNG
ncbi:CDP-diacylglycerol--glycerol-3-phosphate 3-phosphatidyltransferase [Desulfotomaculum arcticum]|uniref:CDP-diacylglycerol--glycerol-3-phosphate 3-phosphatidyltransferase n=1 Tax=Desulfotruncus arcticus DSM 17038 TaxID=1121424 RepID=A0A1I2S7C7_9FIRM|nr:CDP-diacylglycerol--glycerol-3-phosphate 3-phosphatidyltransferase [Desulfotruncus arcticus]SFG48660.1 CDP-diacylglycerol--glycerol-3-phosphate 3-phosphatidyltransferase [Desulfotomaculum arcticum] [Desulfotruncus arcticus DSM 17038]